jgi:TolB-like protein/DNA-binding winged helix-turn-helix (wHTH) protein
VNVPSTHAPIHFGVFELDTENRILRKQGVRVHLQDQPFQILQVLLERPGKVVTRGELQRRIWPSDTFVDFDRGLYNAIKKLREALGDSAESPRFIETLSRQGYRFIAPVSENGSDAEQTPLPSARTKANHKVAIGITLATGALVLLGGFLGTKRLWQPSSSANFQIQSIAVLPLQNLSADPAQEYFSDGMTDALITDLAQIGSIKVISRTSSMRYKQSKKTLPEIARELNVDGIVEGTIQRSGDRVRITAQLIQGPSDKHLWANSYEQDVHDVFALERSVTEDIARQVRGRLTPSNEPPAAGSMRVNPDVLEAYLKGTYYSYKADNGGGEEAVRKSREYFQQAIKGDSGFAPAYIGMANAHVGLPQGSNEDWEIAERSAKKAIELDPSSAEAHSTLGEIRMHRFWDWTMAEKEIRASVSLSPNSAESHGSLCGLLDSLGRLDEALKECETAQELDPNRDHMFDVLYFRGECDRYIPLLRRWIDLYPDFMVEHSELASCYWMKGMYKDSIQEMERTIVLVGLPKLASRVHQAFVTSGNKGAVRLAAEGIEQLASSRQGFYPTLAADLYAQLGNKDRAFYWLEQAYQHPELVSADDGLMSLKVDPMLAPLRSDPRYKDLLHRVGLLQ